jgi:polar amino acid transport system permease protein
MLPGTKPARFGWLDFIILLTLAAGALFVAYRVGDVLHYHWKWYLIPHFILRYDASAAAWVPNLLLQGVFTTIRLSIVGGIIALVVGVIVGIARTTPSLLLQLLGGTYVELIRNIPPLVFIFIFYFFLSSQIMPLLDADAALAAAPPFLRSIVGLLFGDPDQFSSFVPAAFAIGLFEAAFIAEIVRAGLESIGAGQWDAARALGLTRLQALRTVIGPQALARIWPPLAGQFILLIKNSSLAGLIAVPDLTFQAGQVGITTRSLFEVWLTAGVFYFVLCFGLASAFAWLERRSAVGRSPAFQSVTVE